MRPVNIGDLYITIIKNFTYFEHVFWLLLKYRVISEEELREHFPNVPKCSIITAHAWSNNCTVDQMFNDGSEIVRALHKLALKLRVDMTLHDIDNATFLHICERFAEEEGIQP
jgi:hypothetical protein